MRSKPIYPRRVLCLRPEYALWVQAAANYAKCSPEDVVCLALREWVRLPHRQDFARAVSRTVPMPRKGRKKPP